MNFIYPKRALFFLASLLFASTGLAQEVTIGTLMDLEDKIKVKKMHEELEKPSANAPPPPPVTSILPVAAPAIKYPTQAMEIHGVDQNYSGILSMGGMNFAVKKGSFVNGFTVTAITPSGIELTKAGTANARSAGKGNRAKSAKNNVIFAPLPAR